MRKTSYCILSSICFALLSLLWEVLGQSQLVPLINLNNNVKCTQESQCNKDAGLHCLPVPPSGEYRCTCFTNSTTFDEYQGRCVGKVGFPCVYLGNHSFCPEKARCSNQDPHFPSLFYYERRCFCDLNYFGDKAGKCILAARFGESCSLSGKRCDEVSGLKCVDGKCVCSFGQHHQYYDAKKDKCISYVGSNCTASHYCPENARCDGSISRFRGTGNDLTQKTKRQVVLIPPSSVVQNQQITYNPENKEGQSQDKQQREENSSGLSRPTGKCVCDYSFTVTQDGRCLAGYRRPCSMLHPCNHEDNLECMDGSCQCKSPLHQVYDPLLKKCVNLVGAKCSSYYPGISDFCVENAHCVGGICLCREGYSRTPYRGCMLNYGESCENGGCNRFSGLTCKSTTNSSSSSTITSTTTGGVVVITNDRRCSCVDETLIYDAQIRGCVGQLGSPCGKFGQVGEHGRESFFISCESPAICKEEAGGGGTCKLAKEGL